MSLIDLISQDVVKVPLSASDKSGAIRELLDLLVASGAVSDSQGALDALLQRESLGSTGLESGIAVPHAKTAAAQSLVVAIGVSPAGIDFQALDGGLSHLFFLMLAPPDQSGPHIEALAEIARLAKSKAFIRALVTADSPQSVIELLSE
jgi:mannitol/fructose-specific phosphotransferase system IIA component (Ntr-type)